MQPHPANNDKSKNTVGRVEPVGDKMISPNLMVNTSMVVAQLIEQERNKIVQAAISTVEPVWFEGIGDKPAPMLLLQTALVDRGPKTSEGHIIEAVTVPWLEIAKALERDPELLFEFVKNPHKFEEFIAGAYKQAGYSKVELTPASGDKGRDVIATMSGVVTIRVLDQCKAFSPGRVVDANDVRAMAGVLDRDKNASRGVITTTSEFAPGVWEEYKDYIPNRLELRNGPALCEWLRQVGGEPKG